MTPKQNRLTSIPLLGSIISGASVALAGEMFASALQLLVNRQITRAMDAERYGEYGSVLATLSIIGFLLGFGLDTWLLREGGRQPERLSQLLRTVLIVKVFGTLALIAVLAIAGRITALSPSMLIGAVAILGDSLTNTGYAALRTLRRNRWVAAARVLQPLALLGALFAAGGVGITPLWWIGVSAVTSWVLTAFVFSRLRDVLVNQHGRVALSAVFYGAWAFVVADLLANIYTQSTLVLLGTYVSNEAAGYFKAAANIILALQLLPSVVFGVALPMLSNRSVGAAQYAATIRRIAFGALGYGAIAALVAFFGARLLIQNLTDAKYAEAIPLLQIMSIAPALKTVSWVCVAVILSRQRQIWRIVVQIVVAVLNVTAGALIIPRFGATGAAAVVLLTECALLIGYFAMARRSLRDSNDAYKA